MNTKSTISTLVLSLLSLGSALALATVVAGHVDSFDTEAIAEESKRLNASAVQMAAQMAVVAQMVVEEYSM